MKDLWTTLLADHPLRRRIERVLAADASGASVWMSAASIAWSGGYDIAEPPHFYVDRLAELRKSDARAAGQMMSERSQELADEKCAARLYSGKRAWSRGEPQTTIDAVRLAAKQNADREAAIEARAQELVAEQASKSTETARARARKELAV
jgi:hypothetical protein